MKPAALPGLVALFVIDPHAGGRDELADVHRLGSERACRVQASLTLELDRLTIDPSEGPHLLEDLEVELRVLTQAEFTDAVGVVEDGVARDLTRSFGPLGEELELVYSSELLDAERATILGEADSALAGREVAFVWNERTGAYDASFADAGDVDEGLLRSLDASLGWEVLLPREPVAEGDAWVVDPAALAPLLMPGGDWGLVLRIEGEDRFAGFDLPELVDLQRAIAAGLEGRVEARYAGRDADDPELGVVEVRMELEADDETGARLADLLTEGSDERAGMLDGLVVDASAEVRGELRWSLAEDAPRAWRAEGDLELAFELRIPAGETWRFEFAGELDQDVVVMPADD